MRNKTKKRGKFLVLIVLVLALFLTQHAAGAPSSSVPSKESTPSFPQIRLQSVFEPVIKRLMRRLHAPVELTHAKDGSGRLFIVEQRGTIRILKNGKLSKKHFLDIRERVTNGGEKGLLGLAFHPEFSKTRRFFVNYTSAKKGLHTVISEFTVGNNPEEADETSERILLTISQPFSNHNGGKIAFGPDNYLYIGMGDGGAANDPEGSGQDLSTLLGKMLRIDVDKKSGRKPYAIPPDNPFISEANAVPEIFAFGLRNPWRFSFDNTTGLLYVGDVGQNAREEINVIRKGRNYGWNIMEGTVCTPRVNPKCNKKGLDLPIHDYPRSEGTVVVGGYVYRGKAIPGLSGTYIFGDFGNGRIWGLEYDGNKVTHHRLLFNTDLSISALGNDEEGELYVVGLGGEVLKIILAEGR